VRYGDLTAPRGLGPHPVVVAIHGGFWRTRWTRELMVPIARDLSAHGLAVWNIEYRRGAAAWQETLADVAAAFDELTGIDSLDLTHVATLGHSAGGHLAAWLATHREVRGFVGLAPVLDLVEAERRGLGNHAARDFLGGTPDDVPDRYAFASVAPRGPQVIVHGVLDDTVPVDLSRAYADATGARLMELPDADHFSVIDPGSPDWPSVREALWELLA
jgi:acetyl esterase/lipase